MGTLLLSVMDTDQSFAVITDSRIILQPDSENKMRKNVISKQEHLGVSMCVSMRSVYSVCVPVCVYIYVSVSFACAVYVCVVCVFVT